MLRVDIRFYMDYTMAPTTVLEEDGSFQNRMSHSRALTTRTPTRAAQFTETAIFACPSFVCHAEVKGLG